MQITDSLANPSAFKRWIDALVRRPAQRMTWGELTKLTEAAFEHPYWCRCMTRDVSTQRNHLLQAHKCNKCGKPRPDDLISNGKVSDGLG